MSLIRIAIGLLVGGTLAAGLLFAHMRFGLSLGWFAAILIAVMFIASEVVGHLEEQRALRPYWQRYCTGFRWRRRYPDSPKSDIRQFLTIFVDAFGFSNKRRCCFLPEDRVMDIYRARNPPNVFDVDSDELETLSMNIELQYGIDIVSLWRSDITLGDLYELIHTTPRYSR